MIGRDAAAMPGSTRAWLELLGTAQPASWARSACSPRCRSVVCRLHCMQAASQLVPISS